MANLQTNLTQTQIAVKRLSGKAMTNINSTVAQEKIGSTVQTAAGSVFGEAIPASPNSASGMLNIIQSSSNSDPGTVQLVMFEITGSGVEYQNTVATDAGSVGLSGTGNADEGETSVFTYHAYALRLTGSYQADNTAVSSNFNTNASTATNIGTFPYSDNAHLSGSIGKLQIIPEYLGTKPSTTPNPYEVTLFAKDGAVISPGADIDWYLDQYSGMLFIQDPVDYEGGSNQNVIPAKLRAFIYVGKFQDAISSAGGNDNLGNHIATQDLDMAGNSISASLNITASGNISASNTGFFSAVRIPQDGAGPGSNRLYFGSSPTGNNGYLYDDGNTVILGYDDDDILQVKTSTPQVSIGGNLRVYGGGGGNITASANISASSDILANQFKGNYKYLLQGNDLAQMVTLNGLANTIAIGDITTPNPLALIGSSIFLNSPATASGDISASGDIYANEYYLHDTSSIGHDVNNGVLDIAKHIDIQKTSIGNANRSVTIISPLTASQDISGSEDLIIRNITASGDISASQDVFSNHFRGNKATIDQLLINGNGIASTSDADVFFTISTSGFGFTANTGDTFSFNDSNENVDFIIRGANDQELFYADASADKVGIGTTSPSEKLEVDGNVKLSSINNQFQSHRYATQGGSLVMLSASGQLAIDVGLVDGASGPTPLRFYAAHPTLGEINAVTIDCSGSLTIGPNPNLVNNGVFNGYTSSLLPNFGNLNVAGTASIQGDVTASGALFVENVTESTNTGYKTVMYNPTDGRFYRTGSYGGGGGGGTGTPGGSDTQVQFNDGGAFGGDTGLTFNKTTDTLFISGAIEHAGDANTGVFFGSDTITLKGNNAVIAQFDTTEISFRENLLSVGEGLFFSTQLYDWGNNNDVNSISGFRVNNDKAYSHLTPQPWSQRWSLIGMPIVNSGNAFRPYPYNYAVHGYSNNLQVTVTPGQGGGGGGGGGDNPDGDIKPDVGGGGNPGVIQGSGVVDTTGKSIGVPTVSIRGGDLEIIPSGAIEEGNTAGIRIAAGDISGSFNPGIFFYNRDNKTNVSGSFFYESASAEIRFDSASNSIKFLSGETNDNLQEVLHISKSGNNPRIGIGTNQPIRAFDFKEVRDDARGGEILIRGSRSTKGANNGDEVGRINFAIDSSSFGKVDTSGSAAEIVAIVDDIDPTGVEGSLSLRVASAKTAGSVQRIKLIGNPNSPPAVEITGSAEFDTDVTVGDDLTVNDFALLNSVRVGTTNIDPGDGVLHVEDYGVFIGGLRVGSSTDPGANNLNVAGTTTTTALTTTGNVQLSGSYLNLPTLTTQGTVGTSDNVLILDDGVVKQAAQTDMPYVKIADGVLPTDSKLLMFTGSGGTKEVNMANGITYSTTLGWLFSGAGTISSLSTDNFFATSVSTSHVTASGNISASGNITAGGLKVFLDSGSAFEVEEPDIDLGGRFKFSYSQGDPTLSVISRSSTSTFKLVANNESGDGLTLTEDGLIQRNGTKGVVVNEDDFYPNTNNNVALGRSNRQWTDIYATGIWYGDSANNLFSIGGTQRADGKYNGGLVYFGFADDGTGAPFTSSLRNPDLHFLGVGSNNGAQNSLHNEAPVYFKVGKSGSLSINLDQGALGMGGDNFKFYTASAMVHVEAEPSWNMDLFRGDKTVDDTRFKVDREGNTTISGSLSIPGFNDVSASLAAAGGDNLGNHTATQNLDMGGNAITNVGNVDGVDVSTLNSSFNTLEGKTLVSGSAQIASDISGSFTAASASFSTRVTANDAKLTANTSNVQAAGALMDSELSDLAAVKAINQGLTTTSNVIFNHITASGNVSSSAYIYSDRYLVGGHMGIAHLSSQILYGYENNTPIQIGKSLNPTKIVGHITASGDISASGTITGNSIVGTLATAAQTNITSVGTLGSLTMGGDINMDGNTLTMNNGEINGAAQVDASAFRIGNGSAGTPALAFTSDTNTGIYAIAADTLGIAAGGQQKVSIGSTTTTFSNNAVSMTLADADGAVLSVTNTYSSINPTEAIAIKGVGCTATGTPGSSGPQSYGGYFLAGDTNGAAPDTVALYAQGHADGAPNSYAAIFSGSAGGIVGINTVEPTVELDVVGTLAATKTKLAKTTTDVANHNGEVVFFGGTTSMDNGKIYYYNGSGGWTLTDADAASTSTGLLAVALGDSSDTDGMLIRGMITLDHDPGGVGDVLFLQTDTAGDTGTATSTAPDGSGDIVRIIGYCLDASNGQIYFNPSPDFIEVS